MLDPSVRSDPLPLLVDGDDDANPVPRPSDLSELLTVSPPLLLLLNQSGQVFFETSPTSFFFRHSLRPA